MMTALSLHPTQIRQRVPIGLDYSMVTTVLALATLGLVMVASASISYAAHSYEDSLFFFKRHLVYLAIGLMAAVLVLQVPLKIWRRSSNLLFIATFLLLVAVLIPGVGREVNGSRRWIGLGFFNLQVAELAKLATILFVAGYLQHHQIVMRTVWYSFIRPLIPVVAVVVLLMCQPDFGSSVVILATVMVLFFLGGVRLSVFVALLGSAGGLLALLAITSPYRMKRLVSFLDPWSDQFDSGYQLTQSLIAFGRGEWLGVGLGNSVQKLFYLPEAHTDFVFAIFAEELGLVGVVVVVGLFTLLVQRIFIVALSAVHRQDWFAAYLSFGVGIMLAGQAFINVGVTSGLLPTKGLTLPFVSYGGSSLVISCCMVALVLRIGAEMHESAWVPRKVADG